VPALAVAWQRAAAPAQGARYGTVVALVTLKIARSVGNVRCRRCWNREGGGGTDGGIGCSSKGSNGGSLATELTESGSVAKLRAGTGTLPR